jgi:hypothetical protein
VTRPRSRVPAVLGRPAPLAVVAVAVVAALLALGTRTGGDPAAIGLSAGGDPAVEDAGAPAVALPTAPPTEEATAQPAAEEGAPSASAEDETVEALALPTAPPERPANRIPLAPVPAGHEVYAGLSTWIDIYDIEWEPEKQVEVAALAGVDAIFVQSARHKSETDIQDADRLGRLIDAAHDAGIKVMTWYIADFVDLDRDFRRSVEAIRFTTPNGNRPDGFGLDIELDDVRDVTVRNERLLTLTRSLRDYVGPDYPMAAIVLPPLQLDLNGTWWPGFPYAELRPYYDVYIPMSYSSYRGTDAAKTYQWNLDNITETRRRAGDPDLAVHLAGGIADNLPEVDAFVDAARDGGAIGAGLYDLHTTRSSAWPALQRVRLTPGELAGPVPSLVD